MQCNEKQSLRGGGLQLFLFSKIDIIVGVSLNFFLQTPLSYFCETIGLKIALSINICDSNSNKVGTYKTRSRNSSIKSTQPAITCSKLTIEKLEQGVKYVQS